MHNLFIYILTKQITAVFCLHLAELFEILFEICFKRHIEMS